MKNRLLIIIPVLFFALRMQAQPCTPQGDETSYGSGNVWIGYVYDNMNFTAYAGYVNEGTSGNPNFDQSFGGDNVSYATNGCPVNTETFTVRYKLQKTFADGDYEFLIGGDDGFRLSLDGGSTWFINRWNDQAYTTDLSSIHLNGTYNMVLEFYENGGQNRISFNVQATCTGTGNPAIYGTNDVWNGYVYDGTNFNLYKGLVTEGTAGNPNFDQSFGGDYTNYSTGSCAVLTETFSVRYRLRKSFVNSSCLITVGADDGYRLSVNGGATWIIDRWWDQGYNTSTVNVVLNGIKDIVLEFYENGGGNRVSFSLTASLLPIRLVSFDAERRNNTNVLSWITTAESNTNYFEVQKSTDGVSFTTAGKVNGLPATTGYSFTDVDAVSGTIYYRLKLVDTEGQVTWSKIVAITASGKDEINIFPTVTDQQRTLFIRSTTGREKVSLLLYDMSGKKIMTKIIPSLATGQTIPVTLPQNQVTKGTYFVQLQSAGKLIANKTIIVP